MKQNQKGGKTKKIRYRVTKEMEEIRKRVCDKG